MVMERCPNLGLVVDLTNTNRYYNGQIFRSRGIQYKKIYCPGQRVPSTRILKEFFSAVDAFLDESRDSDSLMGVHCTHGLNRTGYFICRYLNLRMGFRPQDAISAFEKARGHKIERQNYVQDILSGRGVQVEPHRLYEGGEPSPRRSRVSSSRDSLVFQSPLADTFQDYPVCRRSRGYEGARHRRQESDSLSPNKHRDRRAERYRRPADSDRRNRSQSGPY
ncbi:RNA/RNP complex-1-interacting phosphatase isoform X2 [Zootermopsis nevadensis]|uniref:Tyrosine-protein phosphatase n=2 Tax=Zootermopsis nevadensis TaxID=136037 RepID=A0A067RRK6_ZOONE|nr:RNA/RNP complex-1-interacting phosphatase isoform X2 [Zootermopsis nevadensis]KDR23270.1 Tyrosine-protein phosphatase [Zootermopsis nevadensis]